MEWSSECDREQIMQALLGIRIDVKHMLCRGVAFCSEHLLNSSCFLIENNAVPRLTQCHLESVSTNLPWIGLDTYDQDNPEGSKHDHVKPKDPVPAQIHGYVPRNY